MPFINLDNQEEKELVPGCHAKFVHTNNVTVAYWRIEGGAAIPDHSHHHEQVVNLIDGRFALTVDGETKELESGMVVTIPPNISHSGKASTPCRIIDVFHPVRDDYKL